MNKVLFLIYSSHSKAGGGHFYSLKTLLETLSNDIDYSVINTGLVFSNSLKNENKTSYVPIKKYNFFIYFYQLYKRIKTYSPDVIHAFDQRSLYIARIISFLTKIPIVYTKCGGPNGSQIIPYADKTIFFSQENYMHFKKFKKFRAEGILIPNRAIKVNPNINKTKELIERYNLKNKFVILRISRINIYYHDTFIQSINLLKEVLEYDKSATLLFVGKIQSQKYFDKLKIFTKNLPVHFVYEKQITNSASKILDVGNIVIGTGRGVMEASSLGKIIFCPIRNSKLPILLYNETKEILFKYNFSERAIFENPESYIGFKNILGCEKEKVEKFSLKLFEQEFNILTIKNKYVELYDTVNHKGGNIINFLYQSLWFFKPKF